MSSSEMDSLYKPTRENKHILKQMDVAVLIIRIGGGPFGFFNV